MHNEPHIKPPRSAPYFFPIVGMPYTLMLMVFLWTPPPHFHVVHHISPGYTLPLTPLSIPYPPPLPLPPRIHPHFAPPRQSFFIRMGTSYTFRSRVHPYILLPPVMRWWNGTCYFSFKGPSR